MKGSSRRDNLMASVCLPTLLKNGIRATIKRASTMDMVSTITKAVLATREATELVSKMVRALTSTRTGTRSEAFT